jgi:hypothetical protein
MPLVRLEKHAIVLIGSDLVTHCWTEKKQV